MSLLPGTGWIPREVIEFFNSPGGHSLIVKGQAGSGKTTFALQVTEELGEVAASHYLSSRVSDESLFNQFPWLRERLKPAVLQLAPKPAHATTKVARSALDQLLGKVEAGEEGGEDEGAKSVAAGDVKEGFYEVPIGFDLPELEAAYDFVDGRMPERSLVLIDSIDALSEHYGIAASKLINVLQRDLVEGSRQNVLYVLEGGGETRLDYLGDGVLNLAAMEHEGRRLRTLTIEKLRGQQVRQHKYLYTLDGGRLTAFEITEGAAPHRPRPWKPIPDPAEGIASTGLRALDQIIGGFATGRVVAIEMSNSVPADTADLLRTAMVCNFVAQGRGVAHVPFRKGTAEHLDELTGPHLPANAFEGHVRVFETAALGAAEISRNALPMEGARVDADLKWNNVEHHLPKAKHPYLALMAFDTLESVYGDKVFEQMSGILSSIRRSKDVFVGFVTPKSASEEKLVNLAYVMLHVESLNGSVVVYGEKPYTELFSLSWDWSEGVPDARLRPIV